MYKKLMALGLIGLSLTTSAATLSSKSANQFCSHRKSKTYVKRLLQNDESRMAFYNHGGLLNGGVCWWHSRFQRNASYLAVYAPNKERPSREEAKKIIKDIRRGRKVVEIPGFSNFYDFSSYFSSEVQDRLEAWQRHDGFVLQKWIIGLAGKTEISADKMKDKMDDLYESVSAGDIVYQKLQIKGIDAHAWLVTEMTKTANGYDIGVIDSNFPLRTSRYSNEEGDTSFYNSYYGNFVAYTGNKGELRRLKRVVKKYCKN